MWTVEGGVYGVCELNCSKSCRTAGGWTRPATPQIRQIRRAVATTFNVSHVSGRSALIFNLLLRQDISQGSITTHLKCGEIFSDGIITNFLLILTVN